MCKFSLWIAAIAGLLMALGAFVLPVQASTISTTDTFSGTAITNPPSSTSPNFIATESTTGTGDLTPLGLYTVTTSGTETVFGSCSFKCFSVTGNVTDTFAGGTLFGTFTDSGTVNSVGVSTGTLNLIITGGTGAYLGYTGTETETATVLANGTFSGTGTGSLTTPLATTPLPSTWMMLLSGFLGLGFFAYRGINKRVVAVGAA